MAVVTPKFLEEHLVINALTGSDARRGLNYVLADRLLSDFWLSEITFSPSFIAVYIAAMRDYFKSLPFSYIKSLVKNEIRPGGPYFDSDVLTNLLIYNVLNTYGVELRTLSDWLELQKNGLDNNHLSLYKAVMHKDLEAFYHIRDWLIESIASDSILGGKTTIESNDLPDTDLELKSETALFEAKTRLQRQLPRDFRQTYRYLFEGQLISELFGFYHFVLTKERILDRDKLLPTKIGEYIIWGSIYSTIQDWILDKDIQLEANQSNLIMRFKNYSLEKLLHLELTNKACIHEALEAQKKLTRGYDPQLIITMNRPIYNPLLSFDASIVKYSDMYDSYFLCKKLCDDLSDNDASTDHEDQSIATNIAHLLGYLSQIQKYFSGFNRFHEMRFVARYIGSEMDRFEISG